eukprot:scaffold35042_cov70-Phaeocystis_antarctica.AAC.5
MPRHAALSARGRPASRCAMRCFVSSVTFKAHCMSDCGRNTVVLLIPVTVEEPAELYTSSCMCCSSLSSSCSGTSASEGGGLTPPSLDTFHA